MKEINAIEAKKLIEKNLNNNEFELIDVRSKEEYLQSHIENSKLIPLEDLLNNLTYFKKDKIYLLYCRSGGRSSFAQNIILKQNKINVINLKGGILDWIKMEYEIKKN